MCVVLYSHLCLSTSSLPWFTKLLSIQWRVAESEVYCSRWLLVDRREGGRERVQSDQICSCLFQQQSSNCSLSFDTFKFLPFDWKDLADIKLLQIEMQEYSSRVASQMFDYGRALFFFVAIASEIYFIDNYFVVFLSLWMPSRYMLLDRNQLRCN